MNEGPALVAISVVTPTYNRLSTLQETVRRVLSERCSGGAVEAVVVDDGSEDGTPEWLEAESARVDALTAIRNPRSGRAAARNVGIDAARGQVVCLLDDDMWVEPGFAEAHWAAHAGRDEPCVVMGRMLPSPDNDTDLATAHYDARLARIDAEMAGHGETLPCNYLCTGNVSLPRSVLEEGVRFDEGFVGYSFEDTELGYRMGAMGVQLVRAADALARHRTDATVQGLLAKQNEAGRSAVRLLKRHPQAAGRLNIPYQIPGVAETARNDSLPKTLLKAFFFFRPTGIALEAGLRLAAAMGLRPTARRMLYLAGYHRYGRAYRRAAREEG